MGCYTSERIIMDLKSVVPWRRSLKEYQDMFLLSDSDLNKSIFGYGDGPACFNAEWTQLGGNVVSADPVYQFLPEQIKSSFRKVQPKCLWQLPYHTSLQRTARGEASYSLGPPDLRRPLNSNVNGHTGTVW